MSYGHLGPCMCGGCDSCLSAQGYSKCYDHRSFDCDVCWCEHGTYLPEESCSTCNPDPEEDFDGDEADAPVAQANGDNHSCAGWSMREVRCEGTTDGAPCSRTGLA